MINKIFSTCLISILFIGGFSQCDERKNIDYKTVKSFPKQVIVKVREDSLFLSFKPNMGKVEFEQTKIKETQNGNLTDGEFILFRPNSKSIEFDIIDSLSSIYLISYIDACIRTTPEDIDENSRNSYKNSYENYLRDILNEKYKIEFDSIGNKFIWYDSYRVITIDCSDLEPEIYPNLIPEANPEYKKLVAHRIKDYKNEEIKRAKNKTPIISFNTQIKAYTYSILLSIRYQFIKDYLKEREMELAKKELSKKKDDEAKRLQERNVEESKNKL